MSSLTGAACDSVMPPHFTTAIRLHLSFAPLSAVIPPPKKAHPVLGPGAAAALGWRHRDMHENLQIHELRGSQIEPWLDALGGLRIRIFRDYPYLYDGTL